MLPPRTSRCPSDLALEQHLALPTRRSAATQPSAPTAAGGSPPLAPSARASSAASRPTCQEDRAPARRGDDRPSRLSVLAREAGGLAVVSGLAALLAVVVTTALRDPVGPQVQVKGSPLVVHVRHAGQVRAATDGETVEAGDALRFTLSCESCRVVVLSIDSRGTISRLAPVQGEAPIAVTGTTTLPGSAELDDVSGPERIFAVLGDDRLTWSAAEEAARRLIAAKPGVQSLREAGQLGLPGTREASLLLERGVR